MFIHYLASWHIKFVYLPRILNVRACRHGKPWELPRLGAILIIFPKHTCPPSLSLWIYFEFERVPSQASEFMKGKHSCSFTLINWSISSSHNSWASSRLFGLQHFNCFLITDNAQSAARWAYCASRHHSCTRNSLWTLSRWSRWRMSDTRSFSSLQPSCLQYRSNDRTNKVFWRKISCRKCIKQLRYVERTERLINKRNLHSAFRQTCVGECCTHLCTENSPPHCATRVRHRNRAMNRKSCRSKPPPYWKSLSRELWNSSTKALLPAIWKF